MAVSRVWFTWAVNEGRAGRQMSLRVVGAGLGRTGTASLKLALERLLGAPCYHMSEVFSHPEHIPGWRAAVRGEATDWNDFLASYAAAVDWPAAAFWPELSAAFPDAIVLLSVRNPDEWWESADETIFPTIRTPDSFGPIFAEWHGMVSELMSARFTDRLDDRLACIASFERHVSEVRESVPASRLVEWTPGDGWAPLCDALGLSEPAEDFPRTNTREEWRSRA